MFVYFLILNSLLNLNFFKIAENVIIFRPLKNKLNKKSISISFNMFFMLKIFLKEYLVK